MSMMNVFFIEIILLSHFIATFRDLTNLPGRISAATFQGTAVTTAAGFRVFPETVVQPPRNKIKSQCHDEKNNDCLHFELP